MDDVFGEVTFEFGDDDKNKKENKNKNCTDAVDIYYKNSIEGISENSDNFVACKKEFLSRNGHRRRMREMYFNGNYEMAPDHNLLELFISLIIPQRDVKEIAYDLINRFGSLEGVFSADVKQLMEVKGVGESVAIGLKLVFDINRRILKNRNENVKNLNSATDAKIYCTNLLRKEKVEKLIMITLNSDNSIINVHIVGTGNVNSAVSPIRQVLQNAIVDNASGVLFAHNHPHGDCAPSAKDVDFTISAHDALRKLNINFIDHIIVGGKLSVSMRMCNKAIANLS